MFTFGRFLPPLPHSDHPNLIRARSGLRLIPDASKRSPYRAPFQNVPKSGLFLKSDEIKRSRIAILRADLIMDRGLGWWEKDCRSRGLHGAGNSIIWGSIWAYFCKQNELIGLIYNSPNRRIFWARILPVNGDLRGICYDGATGRLRFRQTGEMLPVFGLLLWPLYRFMRRNVRKRDALEVCD